MENKRLLILGIGNILWADEGFGVRAVEAFQQKFITPENATILDGGTQGLYLVPYVQECDVLVVFDAVDYGLAPGSIKVVEDDDVPAFMGAKKMSLHQTGFQEVLATAQLLGDYPENIILIGVQPVELDDYGGSLREPVRAKIDPAIQIAKHYLENMGINLEARKQPLNSQQLVSAPSLNINAYETERPDASAAYRGGDMRVLNSKSFSFEPKDEQNLPPNLSVNLDQRVQDPAPTMLHPQRANKGQG